MKVNTLSDCGINGLFLRQPIYEFVGTQKRTAIRQNFIQLNKEIIFNRENRKEIEN